MKTDSWAKCKTINGPDPAKQSSWCAALHDSRGNLWCGVLFSKMQCPWGNGCHTQKDVSQESS